MIDYEIEFRTGDGHSVIDKTTGKRLNEAKDITIKDKVWIAAYCKIMKGVTISEESVIGTSSIVNKPFYERNVIIAGYQQG
jgi:acetyltransferase-like isoleucine patch superfamily enzyme